MGRCHKAPWRIQLVTVVLSLCATICVVYLLKFSKQWWELTHVAPTSPGSGGRSRYKGKGRSKASTQARALAMTQFICVPLQEVLRILQLWQYYKYSYKAGDVLYFVTGIIGMMVWVSVYFQQTLRLKTSFAGSSYAVPKKDFWRFHAMGISIVILGAIWGVVNNLGQVNRNQIGKIVLTCISFLAVGLLIALMILFAHAFNRRLLDLIVEQSRLKRVEALADRRLGSRSAAMDSPPPLDREKSPDATGDKKEAEEKSAANEFEEADKDKRSLPFADALQEEESGDAVVELGQVQSKMEARLKKKGGGRSLSPRSHTLSKLRVSLKQHSLSEFESHQQAFLKVVTRNSVLVSLIAFALVIATSGAVLFSLGSCLAIVVVVGHMLYTAASLILLVCTYLGFQKSEAEYIAMCASVDVWFQRGAIAIAKRKIED